MDPPHARKHGQGGEPKKKGEPRERGGGPKQKENRGKQSSGGGVGGAKGGGGSYLVGEAGRGARVTTESAGMVVGPCEGSRGRRGARGMEIEPSPS